jgi:hypothetical protein
MIGGRKVTGGIEVGVEVKAIKGRLEGEVPVIRKISPDLILDIFPFNKILFYICFLL